METNTVQDDLEFLVNNPDKTMMSSYHDAGSCWQLIDAAVEEIRRLRRQLDELSQKHKSG
ncbi:MAG TPA: hypothetical protein VGZ47_11680 [Gemmataceae bacterium]|jgi:hypothetical protein|nr:hypothetical protein [Gemmataceae bacterium]